MRVFQTLGGVLSEIPQDQIESVQWTDALSGQPKVSLRLTAEAKLTFDSVPDTVLIVPSFRESLDVPVYGPYEMNSDYSWDGTGFGISGRVGADFANDFAGDSSTSILDSLAAQVDGFATGLYEPFKGWTDTPAETDGPNVAKLGSSGLTAMATAPFFAVTKIEDLAAFLAKFGLASYTLVEWPLTGRAATHRLAVWPLHPLTKSAPDDLGIVQTTWAVQPRVGSITAWSDNLPLNFASPNTALPNLLDLSDAIIEQLPNVSAPDLLNAPHGGRRPSYRTRRIEVGYRLAGINQGAVLYHTGSRTPALYVTPQEITSASVPKMAEELMRWDLQNSAARITLRRFVPDDWTSLVDAAVAPHQIITVGIEHFSEGWDDAHREFVVRQVEHFYNPGSDKPYYQQISGTLWQGAFERLEASS